MPGSRRPSRDVVEEEQRPRALHQDVVDAVVDEVVAHRVVAPGQEGEFELGTDAVRAGHQDRALQPRGHAEEPAEGAQPGEGAGGGGGMQQRRDPLLGTIARIDVDAGVTVRKAALRH